MSISVNGQSQVPPGFRFHPTEEELLQYYLRKKVALEKIDLDVIQEIDLNKLEPWDIQEKCKIGSTTTYTSTPQNDWYFFSHKDKKYPTGTRTNRATVAGFWKATGRDKVIYSNSKRIGMRKTLVFYKGRAPHGQKSDWIMHEYRRLVEYHDDDANNTSINNNNVQVTCCNVMMQEEGWVVCRVFKKKNHFHIIKSRSSSSSSIATSSVPIINFEEEEEQGTLEQMLQYMGNNNNIYPFRRRRRSNSNSNSNININDIDHNQYLEEEIYNEDDKFFKLPSLEESPPNYSSSQIKPIHHISGGSGENNNNNNNNNKGSSPSSTSVFYEDESSRCRDWASLDRLVASHLNCPVVNVLQSDHPDQIILPSYNSSSTAAAAANQINIHDHSCDLWSFNCS